MNAKVIDRIATAIFYAIAVLIVGMLLGLIGFILIRGLKVVDWAFITEAPGSVLTGGGGVGPQLFNSFYLLVLTMLITIIITMITAPMPAVAIRILVALVPDSKT